MRWVLAVIKAKAVAVASACLYHMIYSSNVLITYIILSITLILTIYPRLDENGLYGPLRLILKLLEDAMR